MVSGTALEEDDSTETCSRSRKSEKKQRKSGNKTKEAKLTGLSIFSYEYKYYPPNILRLGMKSNRIELNRMGSAYRSVAGALIGLGMVCASSAASALLIDINTGLTGSGAAGTASVGQLGLTQNGANVDFNFNNSANNLPGGIGDDAFISKLLFSYTGASALTSASFSNFGGTQLVTGRDFDIDPRGEDAGYDFYIGLDFPTKSSQRFSDGESTSWTISNVSISDFMNPVAGSSFASVAMVHLQQIGAGTGGADAAKYIVGETNLPPAEITPNQIPEPGSLALTLLGLLGLVALRRSYNLSPAIRKNAGRR
jgi:hypothetical protein